eukprot:GILK01006803.1.p1 GENE.GILK01006803.1~~GILK01006803.1.p1  ORF type:complete len:1005 (+),score=180.37 GILK01006803.1:96-3110(+)
MSKMQTLSEALDSASLTANAKKRVAVTKRPCTLQATESVGLLTLTDIRIPEEIAYRPAATHLLVVDKSGSMAGKSWTQVLQALRYIQEASSEKVEPSVILYDGEARLATMADALRTSASGSTNFCAAFDQIQQFVGQSKSTDIVVTFMTDGEHAARTDPKESLKKLKLFLRCCGKRVTIHTIGFTQSHQFEFLNSIREAGTEPGIYRFASSSDTLDEKFIELFEFVENTLEISVAVDSLKPVKVQCETEFNSFSADVWLTAADLQALSESPVASISFGSSTLQIPVERLKPCASLVIKDLGRQPIESAEDVQMIQKKLGEVKILHAGMSKAEQEEAFKAKAELQERLDGYHKTVAEAIRSGTSHMVLNDLRYASKFTKAGRERRMNQRVSKNASRMQSVQQRLVELTFDPADFESLDKETFRCDLSTEDVVELMEGDISDVLGFGLNISRPEYGVDAPTQITINEISNTICSRSAVEQAFKYKINLSGHEDTHGGFSMRKTEAFAGRGREPINAFLPMYIHEKHWQRVEVLLEPMLGYFFTLDPFGFDQAQYVAAFTVLGHMFVTNEGTERSNIILSEFTKVCQQILPKARAALGFDLVENFIASPAGRTKGVVQNLMTLVGWAYATQADVDLFRNALLEESLRRNFSYHFHGTDRRVVVDRIKNLLYAEHGSEQEEEVASGVAALELEPTQQLKRQGVTKNSKKKDEHFAEWAKSDCGFLKKKVPAPEPETVDVQELEFAQHEIAPLDHPSVDAAIQTVLSLVRPDMICEAILKLRTPGCVVDDPLVVIREVPRVLMRSMLVQALRFCSNTLVNAGVTSGSYINTHDDPAQVLISMHEELESQRKMYWESYAESQRALERAKRIVATTDLWAFVGRIKAETGSRGGSVFDMTCGLLQDATYAVPLRSDKIRALILGRVVLGEGEYKQEYPFIAHGNAWNMDATVSGKFKEVLTEDEVISLQLMLRGRVASHVYRLSDIPNRHGHCNSNPNPLLVYTFNNGGAF